jgi:hypothetical protein
MKIINNDDLLDKWVQDKNKEVENRAKKNAKGLNNTSRGALDHEEVIIFEDADEEYIEEAEGIDGSDNNFTFDGVDYD